MDRQTDRNKQTDIIEIHKYSVFDTRMHKMIMLKLNATAVLSTETELLGPVVQSIVSLMSSLRGQLVKCFYYFITKYTDTFC